METTYRVVGFRLVSMCDHVDGFCLDALVIHIRDVFVDRLLGLIESCQQARDKKQNRNISNCCVDPGARDLDTHPSRICGALEEGEEILYGEKVW